jgi:hypothetical protein
MHSSEGMPAESKKKLSHGLFQSDGKDIRIIKAVDDARASSFSSLITPGFNCERSHHKYKSYFKTTFKRRHDYTY